MHGKILEKTFMGTHAVQKVPQSCKFFLFLPGMMFDMHTVSVGYSVFLSHMIFTLLQHLSLHTPIAKIFYQLWSHALSI